MHAADAALRVCSLLAHIFLFSQWFFNFLALRRTMRSCRPAAALVAAKNGAAFARSAFARDRKANYTRACPCKASPCKKGKSGKSNWLGLNYARRLQAIRKAESRVYVQKVAFGLLCDTGTQTEGQAVPKQVPAPAPAAPAPLWGWPLCCNVMFLVWD